MPSHKDLWLSNTNEPSFNKIESESNIDLLVLMQNL